MKLDLLSLPEDSCFSLSFIWWSGRHLYLVACIIALRSLLLLSGGMLVIYSILAIGVDFIAPVMMRSAWRRGEGESLAPQNHICLGQMGLVNPGG